MKSSQVIIDSIKSKALEGNPLGDPDTRRMPVYLPAGYQADQEYPSLYLLSAFASRGLKMLADDLWEENIQERLDRLISEGKMRPMIVVMPDASTRYGGSQYVNSSATGKYEDHILELVKYIDDKYSTIAEREFRAIAGHSSGGFAATRFGMLHPDIFALVADHSGDKYFELTFKADFPYLLQYIEKVGMDGLKQLLKDPGMGLREGASFQALALSAIAACYSPNSKSKLGFDLPFDYLSGELRHDVWEKWLAFDPVEMLPDYAEALKSLNLFFLDCGKFDEYNLVYGARIFTQKLAELKIPHHYEEFDGGHRNVRYRYDISFTKISEAMPNSKG
jgi:enterochelin esterase family protein